MEYLKLTGSEARPYAEDLARLRLNVFYDYPYLYEGTLDYEMKYLETYFKARNSLVFMVLDHGVPVGATTGIWAVEEEESFRRPFYQFGINPEKVFYFGESVLSPEYRGQGLGKRFFEEREAFAKKLEFIEYLSFCAVVRPESHILKPQNYKPLDGLWLSQGFEKVPNLTTTYTWQDRNEEAATEKQMQFWLKKL